MTTLCPTSFYGTRTAIERPACSFNPTVGAVLWIFAWGGEFASVQILVAWNAKRNAIIEIGNQFGAFCDWLYMVSMNISAIPALLASIVIALKNRIAPFGKIAFSLGAFANQGFTSFPHWGCFTTSPFKQALIGAKRITMVDSVKLISAYSTDFIEWLASFRPASPRAIMGIVRSICFCPECGVANNTSFCYLGIFHNLDYTTQHNITSPYCAIQRWVDMTGGEPFLVEQE